MTLPASGSISFSQINTELGRSASAALSLGSLSNNTQLSLSYFRGKDASFITLGAAYLTSNRTGYDYTSSPYGTLSDTTVGALTIGKLLTDNSESVLWIQRRTAANGGSAYNWSSASDGVDVIFWQNGSGTTYAFDRSTCQNFTDILKWSTPFRFVDATNYTVLLLSNSTAAAY